MSATALPLFTWREDAEADRLAVERAQLRQRIDRLPRMSHRRVELSARLRQLTADELRLRLHESEGQ